jgi:hypothetical protein
MLADALTRDTALLDATTLTWTPTGKNKFDVHDEEGWTLLPNKKVLTVDAYVFAYDAGGTNSEIYNPSSGKWLLQKFRPVRPVADRWKKHRMVDSAA